MPNRLIKESVCTSENIDQLSAFQETFFYRLIVNCDDYGRMDARPQILASKLFPLKGIRHSQVEDALRALTSAELVTLYSVGGKPFLQMKTWDKHQQIRAHKSKYPAPEINCNQMISDDINCNQMISDDIKCSRNPIQSNTESNPNPNTNPTRPREEQPKKDELFTVFWEAYPRKEGKENARKAFSKLKPDDGLMQKMLDAIGKQKESAQWKENGGQFIPYPASWLNGKRWEDEVPADRAPAPRPAPARPVTAQQYTQRDYSNEQEEAMARMIAMFGGGDE